MSTASCGKVTVGNDYRELGSMFMNLYLFGGNQYAIKFTKY